MDRSLTLGNLMNQTFAELGENARILGIFLAIFIPLSALSLYFQDGASSGDFDFGLATGFLLTDSLIAKGGVVVAVVIGAFIINLVLSYWLYAALMARSASVGFGRFLPWLGVYILSSIATVLGFALLLVPGLILITRWVLVLPMVVEGRVPAMDAFGESWQLTSGHGWSIFGAFAILFIGLFALGGIVGGLAGIFSETLSLGTIIISAITEAIGAAVMIAFAVGAFRLAKDTREEIVEVFA